MILVCQFDLSKNTRLNGNPSRWVITLPYLVAIGLAQVFNISRNLTKPRDLGIN